MTRLMQAVTEEVAHRPGSGVVLGSALLAVLLVGISWSVVGHAVTIAHEGGHALVTLLLGGRVMEVKLNRDRTGHTVSSFGSFFITLAGYSAPSLFGLAGVLVLVLGRADVVLWLSIALLALLLTATRNLFGLFTILLSGTVLFLAATRAAPGVEALVTCTWLWLLLVGGLVHVLQHGPRGSDHARLRQMTWIPTTLWALLHTLVAAGSIVLSAALLLGVTAPADLLPTPG